MKIPDKLFSHLDKLDFVKCDVEGYEQFVFQNMQETIKKHRPFVQSELAGIANRLKVIELFKSMNYKVCLLQNHELIEINEAAYKSAQTDFYFMPD